MHIYIIIKYAIINKYDEISSISSKRIDKNFT